MTGRFPVGIAVWWAAAVAWYGHFPARLRLPPTRLRQSGKPEAFRLRGFPSDLFDLTVFQIDRRGAAEDRNFDLEARTLFVDFLNECR
jgi:hypothetical protein